MTEGLCVWNLEDGGRKARDEEENKARPAHADGCADHTEGLGICSDYTRKPLKHLKWIFKQSFWFPVEKNWREAKRKW